jgi:hypothetical protein
VEPPHHGKTTWVCRVIEFFTIEACGRGSPGLRGRVLGSEHPLPLVSMNDLADSLSDQGRYDEGIPFTGADLARIVKVGDPHFSGGSEARLGY